MAWELRVVKQVLEGRYSEEKVEEADGGVNGGDELL